MNLIFRSLDLMDLLGQKYNISFNERTKYGDIVEYLHVFQDESIQLGFDLREVIIKYLKDLKIEKEKILIARYKGIKFDDMSDEVLNRLDWGDLTDYQIFKYLGLVLRTINWVSTGEGFYLLVKYSKNIWNTGWHELAKICRGKVIDIEKRKIIVYPYDKFFNLNEVEETKEENLMPLLMNPKAKVYVTEKKDGSAIMVTKLPKGRMPIINTNGNFDNVQVDLARHLLQNKYKKFYSNVPIGYTFIFELIHPLNKIIVDYGDTEGLYLTGIRELDTFRLLTYPEILEKAKEFDLDITESYPFTKLQDFIDKASMETEGESIKEGWVLRVIIEDKDIMFKLKYLDYFRLSRLSNVPNLKYVYNLWAQNNLDDLLPIMDHLTRKKIYCDLDKIYAYFEYFEKVIIEESKDFCLELGIDMKNLTKEDIMKLVEKTKNHPFYYYIIKYVKGESIYDMFRIRPKISVFERLCEYVDSKDDLTDV